MRRVMTCAAMAVSMAACAPSAPLPGERPASASAPLRDAPPSSAASASSAALPVASATGPRAAEAKAGPKGHPPIPVTEVVELLFPEGRPETEECDLPVEAESIRCWLRLRYGGDKKGLVSALAFYDELGAIPGLEHEHVMEGGFRGEIHIVPERPIGQYQKHFDWVLDAQREIQRVFRGVESKAGHPIGYAYRPIGWKFMRSVGRATPSAYASGWQVGYNVSGSLNTSMKAVRDTLVHEVFHLNDEEHGNWSRKTLGKSFDSIVAKCGTKLACLAPYAPMKTTVRGGTYYAFQPDNGDAVHEYAAELASRYFLETKAVLDGERFPEKAFKCGPEENGVAWRAMAEEFFGGVDLVASACP